MERAGRGARAAARTIALSIAAVTAAVSARASTPTTPFTDARPASIALEARAPRRVPAALWSVPRTEETAHPMRQVLRAVSRLLSVPLGAGVKLVPRGAGVGVRVSF